MSCAVHVTVPGAKLSASGSASLAPLSDPVVYCELATSKYPASNSPIYPPPNSADG